MMLYHGVDVVEVARIRHAALRYGQRFLARVYTAAEQADCVSADGMLRFEALAARWAAKEACAKALESGCVAWARWPLPIVRAPGSLRLRLCVMRRAGLCCGWRGSRRRRRLPCGLKRWR